MALKCSVAIIVVLLYLGAGTLLVTACRQYQFLEDGVCKDCSRCSGDQVERVTCSLTNDRVCGDAEPLQAKFSANKLRPTSTTIPLQTINGYIPTTMRSRDSKRKRIATSSTFSISDGTNTFVPMPTRRSSSFKDGYFSDDVHFLTNEEDWWERLCFGLMGLCTVLISFIVILMCTMWRREQNIRDHLGVDPLKGMRYSTRGRYSDAEDALSRMRSEQSLVPSAVRPGRLYSADDPYGSNLPFLPSMITIHQEDTLEEFDDDSIRSV